MGKKWEGVKEEGVVGRESSHEKLERAQRPGGRQIEAVHRDQPDSHPPLLYAAPNHAVLRYTASINIMGSRQLCEFFKWVLKTQGGLGDLQT